MFIIYPGIRFVNVFQCPSIFYQTVFGRLAYQTLNLDAVTHLRLESRMTLSSWLIDKPHQMVVLKIMVCIPKNLLWILHVPSFLDAHDKSLFALLLPLLCASGPYIALTFSSFLFWKQLLFLSVSSNRMVVNLFLRPYKNGYYYFV